MTVSDRAGRVIHRVRRDVDAFGAVDTEVTLPAGAALGIYTVEVLSGEPRRRASSRCRSTASPSSRSVVTPGVTLGAAGPDPRGDGRTRGTTSANRSAMPQVSSSCQSGPLLLAVALGGQRQRGGRGRGRLLLRRRRTRDVDRQARRAGQARFKVPLPGERHQERPAGPVRGARERCQRPRGLWQRARVATWGDFLIAARRRLGGPAGMPVTLRAARGRLPRRAVARDSGGAQLVRTEWDEAARNSVAR